MDKKIPKELHVSEKIGGYRKKMTYSIAIYLKTRSFHKYLCPALSC